MSEENKGFKLYGLPWYYFAIFSAIVIVATFMGKLPKGMITAKS